MTVFLLALAIGIVAGLRAMLAPAVISWAAALGWLALAATPLWWLGVWWLPWLLTLAAIGELINDKLPTTPSRKIPVQFGTRIITGGLSGAAIGAAAGLLIPGLVGGIAGAIVGTLGGSAVRGSLAARFGSDRPAAFIEDGVAIVAALLIVSVA